jgi:hypothetical protein
LKFSGGGSLEEMRSAAALLERDWRADHPDGESRQIQLLALLGLSRRPVDQLLTPLCASVGSTEPDFVLIGLDGSEDESLFKTFRVGDSPAWR